MCASISDFDSLVCREQVCALFIQSFNCFLYSVIFCNHSVPTGYLVFESVCAMMNMQVLYGTLKETQWKYYVYHNTVFLTAAN